MKIEEKFNTPNLWDIKDSHEESIKKLYQNVRLY